MSKRLLMLSLDKIRMDGGTQSRAELNNDAICEWSEYIDAGSKFPPVIVFYDGERYWLADGFHRCHAHKQAGRTFIEADVRQGSLRDAVLFSVGANHKIGIRRTREDQRRAVDTLLRDEEWTQWSNAEIAKRCNVYPGFVGTRRRLMEASSEENTSIPEQPKVRKVKRKGKTYKINTKNIGASIRNAEIENEPALFDDTEDGGASSCETKMRVHWTARLPDEPDPEPDVRHESLQKCQRGLRKLARESIKGGIDSSLVKMWAEDWSEKIEELLNT